MDNQKITEKEVFDFLKRENAQLVIRSNPDDINNLDGGIIGFPVNPEGNSVQDSKIIKDFLIKEGIMKADSGSSRAFIKKGYEKSGDFLIFELKNENEVKKMQDIFYKGLSTQVSKGDFNFSNLWESLRVPEKGRNI